MIIITLYAFAYLFVWLLFFPLFGLIIGYKPYNYLNLPPHLRLPLARLRSSAHCRMIELGHYTLPSPTPPEECVCIYCGVTEDEEHFLVNCGLYDSSKREYLFSHCTSLNCCFKFMSSRDKFITILLGQDPCRLPFLLADLVRKSFMPLSQFHDVHDEN